MSNAFKINIDPYQLVRLMLNDAGMKARIQQALLDGAMEPSKSCGVANLSTGEAPEFFNLVIATDRDKNPGEDDYIYKSRTGTTAQMRLVPRPEKTQQATRGTVDVSQLNMDEAVNILLQQNPQALAAITKMAPLMARTVDPDMPPAPPDDYFTGVDFGNLE